MPNRDILDGQVKCTSGTIPWLWCICSASPSLQSRATQSWPCSAHQAPRQTERRLSPRPSSDTMVCSIETGLDKSKRLALRRGNDLTPLHHACPAYHQPAGYVSCHHWIKRAAQACTCYTLRIRVFWAAYIPSARKAIGCLLQRWFCMVVTGRKGRQPAVASGSE